MKSVEFDADAKWLTVLIDFTPGTRCTVPGHAGVHPVHDTVAKDYRHLNFFRHECHQRVRTPRVKLPDGTVRLVEPAFAGRLAGFTLPFEALILMLAQQMPFAAVARLVDASACRVAQVCEQYVELGMAQAHFSLKPEAGAALHGLITAPKLTRLARAWIYKEKLREILS